MQKVPGIQSFWRQEARKEEQFMYQAMQVSAQWRRLASDCSSQMQVYEE